jgi:tryptophan synthase alpha chain
MCGLIIAAHMGRTIQQTFEQLKADRRIGVLPFVPAAYPDLATTAAVLTALDRAGASAIEVGFPFSDPIADGPIIQAAFTEALARKIKVADILASIKSVSSGLAAPLVAMVSYSIVFRYGTPKFLADIAAAGFKGLIVPDLPPPEAQAVTKLTRSAGLDSVLLIAPTTAPARRREIAELCTGFVYYLSVAGITGERDVLPADVLESIRQIKSITNTPVCVGFGIHRPQQIAELGKVADGAIVGSALVRRMKDQAGKGPAAIAANLAEYVGQLCHAGRL